MHRISAPSHRCITNSRNLPARDPTFELPKRILLGLASFLTLHICQVKCEDPCSYFITPGHRCSVPLRMRWPYPCPPITVSISTYDSPKGWGPDPCPFKRHTWVQIWHAPKRVTPQRAVQTKNTVLRSSPNRPHCPYSSDCPKPSPNVGQIWAVWTCPPCQTEQAGPTPNQPNRYL